MPFHGSTALRSLSVLLLGACSGRPGVVPLDTGSGTVVPDSGVTDYAEDTGADFAWNHFEDTDTGSVQPDECDALPPLPAEFETLKDFSGAEDFAIDGEGYLVSVDQGKLTGQSLSGDTKIIAVGIGSTAGVGILPNGDYVVNDVGRGELVRITPEGAQTAILSGLNYPNGLTVDSDGFIYVSEQSAGRVRRVDAETGNYEIIAEDLYNPNGLTFSPDFQTLYIGSFGGGTVHAVQRSGSVWTEPELFGETPDGNSTDDFETCEDHAEGQECYLADGGLGECLSTDDGLECTLVLDEAACMGRSEGDSCRTEAYGETLDSLCVEGSDGVLFCATADLDRLEACLDLHTNQRCYVDGSSGTCKTTWEDVDICYLSSDHSSSNDACDGLADGDECEVQDPITPYVGECESHGSNTTCEEPWANSYSRGGLDGINADVCGNVYVTEYIMGYVWRFPPEGGDADLVVETGASWIPNMHFGNGVEGWRSDVLYVMERSRGRLFGLRLGVEGGEWVYQQ